MNEIEQNFYRGSQATHSNTTKNKNKAIKMRMENIKGQDLSRQKNIRQQFTRNIERAEENADHEETKAENIRLKKMLKQAQTKRVQITRQCSEVTKKMEKLEEQKFNLLRKIKDGKQSNEGDKFRFQQLKFLNKELQIQIEQLRNHNQQLTQKLRYQTQIIERKYEDLEERTLKRIQQALKRVKKGIHYLSSLTAKQIQKTKEIQVENLKKTVDILKGKYCQDNYEEQIQQLMNPIKNIQEELHLKSRELNLMKEENCKLKQEIKKHKKVERQLMPQYREAIDKLKKSLCQLRSQLSENQYDKCQIRTKYEQKIKEHQIKYAQLFKEHRKAKLENKIYQKKLQQIQADVEEDRQRLLQENQLLKKLYQKEDQENSALIDPIDREIHTEIVSHKTMTNARKPNFSDEVEDHNYDRYINKATIDISKPKFLKKNFSTSNLRESSMSKSIANESRSQLMKIGNSKQKKYGHLRHGRNEDLHQSRTSHNSYSGQNKSKVQYSGYYYGQEGQYLQTIDNDNSMISQDGLKNQIFKIDKQIMEIQKTLNKQLETFNHNTGNYN